MSLLASKENYKLLLLIVGLLLFFVGLYFRESDQIDIYRIIRGLVSFSCLTFVFVIHRERSSSLMLFYLTLCGIIGLFGMWAEFFDSRILIIALSAVSLIVLAVYVWPKFKKKRLSKKFLLLVGLVLLLKAFLLYQFIEMILVNEEKNTIQTAMLLYAFLAVLMSLLVLVYNKTKNSNASFIFTISWFAFVVSEVFRASGYYEIGFDDVLVHLSRFLFIVSNILLVHYTVLIESDKPKVVKYI